MKTQLWALLGSVQFSLRLQKETVTKNHYPCPQWKAVTISVLKVSFLSSKQINIYKVSN
jgi:hypothetical protein